MKGFFIETTLNFKLLNCKSLFGKIFEQQ